jgi:hypothetical protein
MRFGGYVMTQSGYRVECFLAALFGSNSASPTACGGGSNRRVKYKY